MAQHDPARKRTILDGVMETSISRRTLAKGAAWSVPAIALAVATPAASASTDVDLGAFALNGVCGILGVIGPGFTLTAGPDEDLPIGTTFTITGSGVANIGVFSVTGGAANVQIASATSRVITLTAALAAGATIAFRTTLSISVAFVLDVASVGLPSGYIATGAKTTAGVSSTLIDCDGS